MATLLSRTRRYWLVAVLGLFALIGATSFAMDERSEPVDGALVAHDDGPSAPVSIPTATPPEASPTPAPSPTPAASPAPVPEKVRQRQPDVVVRPERRAPDISDAMKVKGVEHLAAAAEFDAEVATGDGRPASIDVMAVSADTFRSLTPSVTAQAPAVWQRLGEGDVVLRHDIANKLGVELGADVEVTTDAGTIPLRVGAFASNGAPPLADALVSWQVATELGQQGVTTLVLDVADGRDPEKIGRKVLETMGPGKVELREAPETRKATGDDTGRGGFDMLATTSSGVIEPFSYTDLGDGMIVIDPNWVSRWIAAVEIPGFGTARCHRVMIPQLIGALQELHERGLYDHLRPDDFGGCHVPRHIDFDPGDPLSMHAWGLAIDFNVSTNGLGDPTPEMDRRVVEVFERWGFQWGGWWSRPDGMHFELERVLTR